MTDIPISMRRAGSEDLPFFFSATLQSYFYSSPQNKIVHSSVFYPEHKRLLGRLVERPKAMLGIACLEGDEDVIIGFILAEPLADVLHYLYVKQSFRGFGVARRLLDFMEMELGKCSVSHWTDDLARISRRPKYSEIVYNPYLLME